MEEPKKAEESKEPEKTEEPEKQMGPEKPGKEQKPGPRGSDQFFNKRKTLLILIVKTKTELQIYSVLNTELGFT